MATSNLQTPCPLCSGLLVDAEGLGRAQRLHCRNCGEHRFSNALIETLATGHYTAEQRARIAYRVKRVGSDTMITTQLVDDIERTTQLPSAEERVDNLLIHFAETGEPGSQVGPDPGNLRATFGCGSLEASRWVIEQAIGRGYLVVDPKNPGVMALSVQGWTRYEEHQRAGSNSKHAFMAMSFGHEDIGAFYRDHLRGAVEQTGFKLRKTNDEHASAGAIDVRMKVEIRTSRFLLCDLSHGNRGAYWEAGFAEGVGRPVVYLCRADVLADKRHEHHPHFDTANQLIVAWDPASPAKGLEELKAVIRATLPSEAKMED